jgi:anti-sigma regulatory factor (Ser/Thr protein kinase)
VNDLAVRKARQQVRDALATWGIDCVDDAVLVVSELVTNAVRHAREHGDGIGLLLILRPTHLILAVKDGDLKRVPDIRPADQDAECGRGLALIDALADNWGATALTKGGKAVWAVFRHQR